MLKLKASLQILLLRGRQGGSLINTVTNNYV